MTNFQNEAAVARGQERIAFVLSQKKIKIKSSLVSEAYINENFHYVCRLGNFGGVRNVLPFALALEIKENLPKTREEMSILQIATSLNVIYEKFRCYLLFTIWKPILVQNVLPCVLTLEIKENLLQRGTNKSIS